MDNKIIQWKLGGERVNYSELLLLIIKYYAEIICLQETHFKSNNTINIKKLSLI